MAFYKRSVFLINPSFQLKFSLIVCSVIVISTLIYPLIIYEFFDVISKHNQQIAENIIATRNDLIIYLIFIQLVVALLVFIAFIFFTHKIAGPLYKLKTHLQEIREGKPITPLTFRDGDYFQDVADEINLFLETIYNNQENDFQYITEISQYLNNLSMVVPDDKKIILSEISRRLLEIKSRYKSNF